MNDTLDVTITDVAYRGAGVARVDRWVVFVPGALPGEQVRIRVTRRKKQYGEAVIEKILVPSPQRVPPACPLAGTCPGCSYQSAAYAEEVRLKQAQLAQLLQRGAKISPDILLPPLASPQFLHYRNKIVLHGDDHGRLGYFATDNTSILDVPACPLAHPSINARLTELRADPAFMNTLRARQSLTLRHTETDGALHWLGRPDPKAPWLRESSRLGLLHVPRGSFFQVNPGAANLLLDTAQAWLREQQPRAVVDLYCGVGVFALAAAQAGVPAAFGIDSDPAAIEAATRNAQELNLPAATFSCGAAQDDVRAALARFPADTTLLIVDPPRMGLTRELIADVARARPAAMLYISCAADTLARDLALLTAAGYKAQRAQLVDMFPRTAYFETLVLLTR